MEDKKPKQIQIQFKLADLQLVQFATLTENWPDGELQVDTQLNFVPDTTKRHLRCLVKVEFKKNDITQLLCSVQSLFEFAVEGWSAMYDLNTDSWILPCGLVQHIADLTLSSMRGIIAVKSEESDLPRVILPLMSSAQFIKDNLALKRTVPVKE